MKIDTYRQKSILQVIYCLIILAILKNIWFYNKLSCKHCVHIPTHLQGFVNVFLTSLQELYKITVFHNLFSSLQHIFPRHSLLTNDKIFMCRFQYCNCFWVKSESQWQPAICVLNLLSCTSIIYDTRHFLIFDDTKPDHFNRSLLQVY